MTKAQVNNYIYYYEVIGKPRDYIIGYILSIWKEHISETILTSDDVLNIKYAIG